MGGGAGGSPAPPPYLGERTERIGFVGTFRLGGVPQPVLKVGSSWWFKHSPGPSVRASDSRSARSSMRFMTSSSSTASTWAETPWSPSPTPPIQYRWYAARSENSQVREALVPTNGDHAQPQGTAAEHDTNQRRGRGTSWVTPASSFKHNVWLISIEVPHRFLSRRLASPLQHVRRAIFSQR